MDRRSFFKGLVGGLCGLFAVKESNSSLGPEIIPLRPKKASSYAFISSNLNDPIGWQCPKCKDWNHPLSEFCVYCCPGDVTFSRWLFGYYDSSGQFHVLGTTFEGNCSQNFVTGSCTYTGGNNIHYYYMSNCHSFGSTKKIFEMPIGFYKTI